MTTLAGKTFLITGGHGFVGRVLRSRLERDGAATVSLSRHADRSSDLVADLTDVASVERALSGRVFDGVFHLAAAGVTPGENESVIFRTNVEGTVHLLQVLERLPPCPIIVAGSWTEYGASPIGIMTETDTCHPASTYGISKLASTLLSVAWAKRVHHPLIVLRFFSLYGSGEAHHRLGPTAIRAFRSGSRPEFGCPDSVRDFVHVEDAAEACVRSLLLSDSGTVLNVGTGVGTTIREFVERIRQAVGATIEPLWNAGAPRPWDVPKAVADTTEMRERLSWVPSVLLSDGIRQIVTR